MCICFLLFYLLVVPSKVPLPFYTLTLSTIALMIRKLLTAFLLAIAIHFTALAQDPSFKWASSLGGGGNVTGNSIAVDNQGYSYITGSFTGTLELDRANISEPITSEGDTDIFLAKFNPSGEIVYIRTFGSSGEDEGLSLVVDAMSNVYLAGRFSGTIDFDPGDESTTLTSAGASDIFFAKYNEAGDYVMAYRIGSTGNDQANAIAIDAVGNLYLAGSFTETVDFDPGTSTRNLSSAGNTDGFFAKYNREGIYQYAMNLGGTGADNITSIITDGINVYLTGYFSGTLDFNPDVATEVNRTSAGDTDIFVAKFGGDNGNFIAVNTAGSSGMDRPNAITIDAERNVYITGASAGAVTFDAEDEDATLTGFGDSDIFFAKYNRNLEYEFARIIGSTGTDEGKDIAVDLQKNIYVTGNFNGQVDFDPGNGTRTLNSENTDMFLAKFSPEGNHRFSFRLGGSGEDDARAIFIDEATHIYLTGGFQETSSFNLGGETQTLTASALTDGFVVSYGQSRTLASIASLDDINVPLGTAFDSLDLPLLIAVTYSDGSTQELAVSFNDEAYNGDSTGVYMIAGAVTLPPGVTNPNNLSPSVRVTVGTPTSAPLPLHARLSIYPNPSTGIFTIETEEEALVRIINLKGQVIATDQITASRQIDLSGKEKGMYVVQVTTQKGQSVFRVVLQ
jgi:hypothetical protein